MLIAATAAVAAATASAAACIAAAAAPAQSAARQQPNGEKNDDEGGIIQADTEKTAIAVGRTAAIAAVTKHNGKPPFHWDHPILCHEQILVQRLIRLMPSILRREKGGKIQ